MLRYIHYAQGLSNAELLAGDINALQKLATKHLGEEGRVIMWDDMVNPELFIVLLSIYLHHGTTVPSEPLYVSRDISFPHSTLR